MAFSYSATASVAGREVRVEADTYEELHAQLAGLCELEDERQYLLERGAEEVVPSYRKDPDENEYYGFKCRVTGKDKTFGKKRDNDAFPFFPRRGDTAKEAGYYDPQGGARAGGQESSGSARRPRPPRTPESKAQNRSQRGGGQGGGGRIDAAKQRRLWSRAQGAGHDAESMRSLLLQFGYEDFSGVENRVFGKLMKAAADEERLREIRGAEKEDELPF